MERRHAVGLCRVGRGALGEQWCDVRPPLRFRRIGQLCARTIAITFPFTSSSSEPSVRLSSSFATTMRGADGASVLNLVAILVAMPRAPARYRSALPLYTRPSSAEWVFLV